jgi:hypothetical protein
VIDIRIYKEDGRDKWRQLFLAKAVVAAEKND